MGDLKGLSYKNETLFIERDEYIENGNLALNLWHENDEFDEPFCEPYARLTVNLSEKLSDDEAYVDTNNFPCAEEFIKKNKLGVFTGKKGVSGFCEYPMYKFNLTEVDKYVMQF